MAKKIIAITMVKNEADVIESFVRHTLSFADELLVADHQSTDGTRRILTQLQDEGLPVFVRTEYRAAYLQAEVMTALLREAAEARGADLVVPLDADEFLLPETDATCREVLEGLATNDLYHVVWRRYVPAGGDDGMFLLARPLRRTTSWDKGGKCIVGGAAARQAELFLCQGNHCAYVLDAQGHEERIKGTACALSIAHFYWRSDAQYRSKVFVGWMNIAARYGSDTTRGGDYRTNAERLLHGEDIAWQDILPETEACSLAGRFAPQTLRYAGAAHVDVFANVYGSALALAQSFATGQAEKPLVTSVVPYCGAAEPFAASLASVQDEVYPQHEIFVPVLAGALPQALRTSLDHRAGVTVLEAASLAPGERDVFDALAKRAAGELVEWVLPGETVLPQKLLRMVTCFALQPEPFALLLSDGGEASEAAELFAPVGVTAGQNAIVPKREAAYKQFLGRGKLPAGGFASMLVRRELFDACGWLRGGFAEGRPRYFALLRLLFVCTGAGMPYLGMIHTCYHGGAPRLSLEARAWQQMAWHDCLQADGGRLSQGQRAQASAAFRENGIAILSRAVETGEDTSTPVWQTYQSLLQADAADRPAAVSAVPQKPGRRVLCLTLSLGGGAHVFLGDYVKEELAEDAVVWVLQPYPPAVFPPTAFCVYAHGRKDAHMEIPFCKDSIVQAARQLGATEIFINHLLGFALDDVAAALSELALPYTFFLHDYFAMCPNFSLIRCQARMCGAADEVSFCRAAFESIGMKDWTLARYRETMHGILAGAERVLAPTHYAAGIVQAVYPDIAIGVRPHRIPFPIARTFQPAFADERPLTLAMVGAIWEPKGEAWLLYLRDVAAREHLPVRFVAVGDVMKQHPGIDYTGRYQRENLAHILAEQRAAVVLCPSTVPETYCYTASEALLAGYPVLTMNLGAQAARVQRTGAGWVLPQDTRAEGEAALAAWLRRLVTPMGRREIVMKARQAKHFVNGEE